MTTQGNGSDSEPQPDQPLDAHVDWRVRLLRSRAYAWLELCRPYTGTWMLITSALMVVAAAEGSLKWSLPFQYCGMIVCYSYAAGLINNAIDAGVDANSRLMRPISAGKVTPRSALIAAIFPLTLGSLAGFLNDW